MPVAGPPPRAWRAPNQVGHSPTSSRTTSTCVESTLQVGEQRCLVADHLHVRGEHVHGVTVCARAAGPPPRAWRARQRVVRLPAHARTTSTCVESTEPWSARRLPKSDHLHVRGEHQVLPAEQLALSGPPPRAWRARGWTIHRRSRRRTTSTCVESTLRPGRRAAGLPDHLHVRGEHAMS